LWGTRVGPLTSPGRLRRRGCSLSGISMGFIEGLVAPSDA